MISVAHEASQPGAVMITKRLEEVRMSCVTRCPLAGLVWWGVPARVITRIPANRPGSVVI